MKVKQKPVKDIVIKMVTKELFDKLSLEDYDVDPYHVMSILNDHFSFLFGTMEDLDE